MASLTELIEASDLDGLVRYVDGRCAARDWDGLVELRHRCEEAVERGKQVWAAAQYAEYRLALEAPSDYLTDVVVEGAGRFALGPLWEVAASTHTWDELSAALAPGPARGLVAHERALRGDVAAEEADDDADVLAVPLGLEAWEPVYPVATYRPDKADFPEPMYSPLVAVELGSPGERREDQDDVVEALYAIARPWAEQSNGHNEVVAVSGTAQQAVRALGPHRVRMAEVSAREALTAMTWTAASGGAYGQRRGTAVGRSTAWWAVAAVAGLDDVDPDALENALGRLTWYRWDPGSQSTGWGFHLAVARDDLAWAVSAVDGV